MGRMGSLLNGRYELGDVLGSGGMGRVHRATDTRLARPVAIKILRSGDGQDTNARARFRAEAQLAGSLHHPGVAQIYDVGEDESSAEHDPFIVMQLIDGTPLSRVLAERGSLPPDEVASIIGQVADALDSAHSAGIVHRDLKPSNVMITPAGKAVLVDFGIAWSATSEPLTATGSIIGTADYFSPEQASGRPATARSDLYSLGLVAHHCLTGSAAFRRESPVATAMAQLRDDLPPLGGDVPAALSTLITALTEKNPDDRPSSAAIVASLATADHPATAILAPVTAAMSTTSDQTAPVPSPVASTTIQPPPTADRPARPMTRYAGIVAVAVVLALAAVMGVRAMGSDPAVVPDVVGMSADSAVATIQKSGLTARQTPVDVADVAEGDVARQQPAADTTADEDGVVTISVATGKVEIDAAALEGTSYTEAAAVLADLGLEVAREDKASSETTGDVIAVDQSGRISVGSTVTLTVATAVPVATQPAAPASSGKSKGNGKSKDKGKKKK